MQQNNNPQNNPPKMTKEQLFGLRRDFMFKLENCVKAYEEEKNAEEKKQHLIRVRTQCNSLIALNVCASSIHLMKFDLPLEIMVIVDQKNLSQIVSQKEWEIFKASLAEMMKDKTKFD